jgi:hypothetical protein
MSADGVRAAVPLMPDIVNTVGADLVVADSCFCAGAGDLAVHSYRLFCSYIYIYVYTHVWGDKPPSERGAQMCAYVCILLYIGVHI